MGSYSKKVERMVARMLGGDPRPARRVLCKCDLTTELVKEFTELQGVVGGLYARAQGEPEAVWQRDLRSLQAGEHGRLDSPRPRPAGWWRWRTRWIRCANASASA